jgi:NAD-dependent deacetylase
MSTLEAVLIRIKKEKPRRVVAFTGAGISAESGVPTFRSGIGLWQNFRPEELATPEAFERDPALVWEWYEWRRDLIRGAAPNAAHLALALLERQRPAEVTVVTQNVDGLHRRAGSTKLLELHGNIFRTRCTADGEVSEAFAPFRSRPPRCACGALLRPDIVWFGEMLPEGVLEKAALLVAESDLLMVIGTSGVVYPAAGLVTAARRTSIEINPQVTPLTATCSESVAATAAYAVPAIVEAIISGGGQ